MERGEQLRTMTKKILLIVFLTIFLGGCATSAADLPPVKNNNFHSL